MEIDRVQQMGGVNRQSTPAWPDRRTRRRHFVEELNEAESDAENTRDGEDAPEEAGAEPGDDAVPAELQDKDDGRGSAFDVIA